MGSLLNILQQCAVLVLITLIPALELRASIPIGIYYGSTAWGIERGALPWPVVVLVCVVANIVLGWGVFAMMGPVFRLLEHLTWFRRRFEPILLRTQARLKPYVDKYGEFGVAVFIGIPLPGSGVYTGAVGAYLLGLDRRKFAVANVIGVLIAAAAVTVVTLLMKGGMQLPWLQWMLKGGH
jgi:uncharacterized membrane protein